MIWRAVDEYRWILLPGIYLTGKFYITAALDGGLPATALLYKNGQEVRVIDVLDRIGDYPRYGNPLWDRTGEVYYMLYSQDAVRPAVVYHYPGYVIMKPGQLGIDGIYLVPPQGEEGDEEEDDDNEGVVYRAAKEAAARIYDSVQESF